MDFGKFLGDVGNFFGGLFGGGKKKKQDENRPQVTVQQPSLPAGFQAPGAMQNTAQMPRPLIQQPQAPVLGGVNLPNPEDVAQAQRIIEQGGSGTPFKPQTIDAARQATVAQPRPFTPANLNMPGQNNPALNLNMPQPIMHQVQPGEAPHQSIIQQAGAGINDFFTNPNNAPRNVLDYVLGLNNPLDNASYDYSHKDANGNPTLVPHIQNPQNLNEAAHQSLAGDILNQLLVKPTIQAPARIYNTLTGSDPNNLPQWVKDLNSGFGGYQTSDLKSNYADGANPVAGTIATVGDIASLLPAAGTLIKGGTKAFGKAAGAIGDEIKASQPTVNDAVDAIRQSLPSPNDVASAVKQAPIIEKPQAITSPNHALPPAEQLGSIAHKSIVDGTLSNDTQAQELSGKIGDAIEAASQKAGSTWEEINGKIQDAWSKGLKNYKEAGLTKDQFDVARKAADELSLLRSRVDPSLVKEGQVGQFYSPRQAKGTEFTQELVNEISRGTNGAGLTNSQLDLSTAPYRQAIRRYSNAPEAISDRLVSSIETKTVTDELGNSRVVDSGVKIPEEAKTAFKENLKPYVQAQDDAIRASDAGNPQAIDEAISRGDKAIDDAINKMADSLPKDTVEARNAIGSLIAERRAYMQSTARTNMFSNIVNRIFDQTQKGIVNTGDKLLPLVNKISSKMVKSDQPGIATDRLSSSLAKKYARGTLINQQNRNFMTNVRLAGANARNPLTKGLAKADAAYRAAGTYLTSLGDLSTNAVKATNLAILGKAKAEGITGAKELEAYLVKNLNSPEYLDIYRNMSNQYSGYIGMPQTITSTGTKGNKYSELLSKIDNGVKNAIDKTNLPDRVKQELNDIIMPSVTGFAGATSRVAAKQLNALALGIPNVVRGLKLAASDTPNARAIGEMMISRSIIDGVAAGGIATGGALLGFNGHWTGSYPSDPNERARWEKDGIQPDSFSFDVGGKTVYIEPGRILGVLALPMVLPAVVAESAKNGGNPADAIGSIIDGTIGQFNKNLGTDAIIQHMGDLNSLINGNDTDKKNAQKNLINMLGFSISNLAPAAGLQNNIANASDPYKRDTSGGIGDVIAARNPFTRESLPVKNDNLGNPIANPVQDSLGSSAISVGSGQSETPQAGADPLNAEIDRLAKAKYEVVPARDVKNTASQNDAKLLMNTDLYQKADDEMRASMIKDALLGTKTKDISPNISDSERSALIQYKLQDDDHRKKWLEDNNNSAEYYTGDYNNLKARDLLTSDDENLNNKSGAKYKMLRAQVDKQYNVDSALKQLYDDTSVSEWRAMTDPESDSYDPETASKLMGYDEVRTKSGVSGKSGDSGKPKYTEKTGKGRKGVSAADKFAFASLPSSLIGSQTSSKGYANAAPTFKPIADLQAPATVAVPKGRSISIKRGVQL